MTASATAKAPRVLFVADAGPRVGGGHVMRCLTLAGALERAGADCAILATEAAAGIVRGFGPDGLALIPASATEIDALIGQARAAAAAWRADWIVLDHYGATPAHEQRLRPAAGRLLVIDDLARPHVCDLVLDSNLGRDPADYPGLEVLAGPAFTLVRPQFAALREASLARRRGGGEVERVLLALGLTDLGAITNRVAGLLAPVLGRRRLDVVLGGGSPSLAAIRARAAADPRFSLHIDTRDMAALTAGADLAIGAGGSSTWERCCLGLPTLTLVLAPNQSANAQALEAIGATLALDVADADFEARLVGAFAALAADPVRRAALGAASSALCDGLGAARVARRIVLGA